VVTEGSDLDDGREYFDENGEVSIAQVGATRPEQHVAGVGVGAPDEPLN